MSVPVPISTLRRSLPLEADPETLAILRSLRERSGSELEGPIRPGEAQEVQSIRTQQAFQKLADGATAIPTDVDWDEVEAEAEVEADEIINELGDGDTPEGLERHATNIERSLHAYDNEPLVADAVARVFRARAAAMRAAQR
ncbi:MAG TPA: hypothetical protein VF559_08420 [Caulobacteraceae bacterium]|jgi:hypothetical protein